MRAGWQGALVLAAMGLLPCAVAGADDPESLIERLRSVEPDFDRAVEANGLAVKLDYGELRFDRGLLVPLRVPGEPRTFELLFSGQARIRVEAPDPVEARQLALFTAGETLEAGVRRAVLTFGDGDRAIALLGGPRSAVDPERRTEFGSLAKTWLEEYERGGASAEDALLKSLLGDAPAREYVGIWFDAARLGVGYYEIDPWSAEPVALGGLERIEKEEEEEEEEPDPEDPRVRSFVWLRAIREGGPTGEPPGVEPRHYTIRLALSAPDLAAEGEAVIRLVPNADGLRVVTLHLDRDSEVRAVHDGEGRELPFRSWRDSVHVALARPTSAGVAFDLTVEFGGEPVRHWLGRWTLKDTMRWHPHAGRIDRAEYDVTVRWPEGYELLATGRRVERGSSAGEHWERRVLEVPASAFSFEIGDFEVHPVKTGHVELRFGFCRSADPPLTEEVEADVIEVTRAALLFFETHLGHLPIDDLTVAMVDRGASQGFLGLLTLDESMILGRGMPLSDNRTPQEVRYETIAHEMAHQWWGNLVGWDSYRDQWLSEALADYSADRFLTRIAVHPEGYLNRHARMWRAKLGSKSGASKPLGSLGPVVLGTRLYRNHGLWAYSAIVYDKGSAVFSTLAQQVGREPLWRMLGALAPAVNNRVIGTSTFLAALERMSGRDLEPFARQYVYGVGMPAIFYEYRCVADGEGGWTVRGSARQLPSERSHFEVRRAGGHWDVVRQPDVDSDVGEWVTVVPFRVDLAGDAGDPRAPAIFGNLELRGERSVFSLPVQGRPTGFRLDPRGEVLAELEPEQFRPKSHLRAVGERLLRLGRLEEALETLGRALDSDVVAESAAAAAKPPEDPRREARRQDVRIHLARARAHLDGDAEGAARKELRAAESLLPADSDFYHGERVILQARLDLRAGLYDGVLDRLYEYRTEHLGMHPQLAPDPSRMDAWQVDEGELLGLAAVAAHETGARELAEELVSLAEAAGVSLDALGVRP